MGAKATKNQYVNFSATGILPGINIDLLDSAVADFLATGMAHIWAISG